MLIDLRKSQKNVRMLKKIDKDFINATFEELGIAPMTQFRHPDSW